MVFLIWGSPVFKVWMEMCRWAADQPFPYADELAHSEVPLLVLAGDHDRLAPPVDAYSLYEASGSDDRTFMLMEAFEHGSHWGHLDLVLGHRAPGIVWSEIAAWLEARS